MNNKTLLLSLQRGIVKELCSMKLLTEEQTQIAIKKIEQVYEQNIIEEEAEKNEKGSCLL